MVSSVMARQLDQVRAAVQPLFTFLTQSTWSRRHAEPDVVDLTFGNPHEPPRAAFSDALQRWSAPQGPAWFGYKLNEPAARATIAASLRHRRGVPFEEEDVFLTTGAFAGLAVALRAIIDPGDEVLFISPTWFFYAALIVGAGATPVRVRARAADFDLDLGAIAAAITPRTRAIIVNSPHNPTGRVYPPATLARLANLLTLASTRHGRPIYLLADEAYCRIVFDGREHVSPTAFYPHSFLIYTYGKTLLTPGQRLGYLALPPTLPLAERAVLREAILMAQMLTGWAFPNALLQHALPDLERLSIDIGHLQRKRDRLVEALRALGYAVHAPEGTFYLLPHAPLADDLAFSELLAEQGVLVLPGSLCEAPGYLRLSLTASDDMLARALPAFATAMRRARHLHSAPARDPVGPAPGPAPTLTGG